MRFVHTSDWHLGRRLGEASLIEDQAHALEQVLAVCREAKADALVVAGDVYDRAVPPVEALGLFNDVLARCAKELRISVVVAAGNHDSPERLAFGRELLAASGVRVYGALAHRLEPALVRGVPIYVLPFCEPEAARAGLGDPELRNHDAAVRAALADMRAAAAGKPAVLVAHLFAAGGQETADSERPLSVGTAGQVGVDALGGWSYVALGHLHAPQRAGGRDDVRYSGSLYKYSFGEARQEKGVCVVEVDAATGAARVETVPLVPRRDVMCIEGEFEALLRDPGFAVAEGAYVEATYTDAGYVVDAANRLRARFPHLLAARPRQVLRQVSGEATLAAARASDDLEVLRGFWRHVQAEGELDAAHLEAWARVLGAARAGEREVALEALP